MSEPMKRRRPVQMLGPVGLKNPTPGSENWPIYDFASNGRLVRVWPPAAGDATAAPPPGDGDATPLHPPAS